MPAPLQGRRIVVTRPRDQAEELAHALEDRGAAVVRFPVIRIDPEPDLDDLRAALAVPDRYRWIVLTSQNAVQVVWDRLESWGLTLGETPVAAIGPATAAALRRRGVTPALVPDEHVAESLLRRLLDTGGLRAARVLLPTAREARDVLSTGLRAAGAIVDVIPVYRTVRETAAGAIPPSALAADIQDGSIAAVTFTASSAVRHFVDLVGRAAATTPRFVAAVIGPVTAATARELGVSGAEPLEASPFTVPALVEALCRRFS
jgi:uroporphyrinogen III methyltransferase / synthase